MGALIPVFIVIVLAVAVGAWLAEKKRREALQRFADSLGLQYSHKDPLNVPGRFHYFKNFQSGDRRYARNVLYGAVDGRAVTAFDFFWEEDRRDSKGHRHTTTHSFSAVVVDLPISTVELYIRPEGLFDKLAGWVGFDDIDFESDEFSRKFMVKCADKRFAYDVIHPRMMEFLLGRGGLSYEMERDSLCVRSDSRYKPEQVESMIRHSFQFVDLLPRHLVKDRQSLEGGERGRAT